MPKARFNLLADSLLIEAPRVHAASGGRWVPVRSPHGGLSTPGTWRWRMGSARRRTGLPLRYGFDEQYALAELWLAQVLSWSGKPVEDWRPSCSVRWGFPIGSGLQIGPGARRSVAFTEGRFAESCDRFRAMVVARLTGFQAWFGLGDCQANDPTVIRDARVPSGWSFRSSYQGAIHAYSRALTMLPSSYRAFKGVAFERLNRVFFTEPNTVRTGFAVDRDTLRFGAFPSLAGDTLAFVPYPIGQVAAAQGDAFPPSMPAAIARNRDQLRSITEAWLAAFPTNPDAIEAHARVLESLGELRDDRPAIRSALLLFRDGRAAATDPDQRTRLEVGEFRVLLKLGRFDGARRLADSLLSGAGQATPTAAATLASVAALTGRPNQIAALLGQAASTISAADAEGTPVAVPAALRETWLELLGYAAVGEPRDSLDSFEQRLLGQVRTYVAPGRQQEVKGLLLHQVHTLEYHTLGLRSSHQNRADRRVLAPQAPGARCPPGHRGCTPAAGPRRGSA